MELFAAGLYLLGYGVHIHIHAQKTIVLPSILWRLIMIVNVLANVYMLLRWVYPNDGC